jgi:hypothetical protein
MIVVMCGMNRHELTGDVRGELGQREAVVSQRAKRSSQ